MTISFLISKIFLRTPCNTATGQGGLRNTCVRWFLYLQLEEFSCLEELISLQSLSIFGPNLSGLMTYDPHKNTWAGARIEEICGEGVLKLAGQVRPGRVQICAAHSSSPSLPERPKAVEEPERRRWGLWSGGQGRLVHITKLMFHPYLSVCACVFVCVCVCVCDKGDTHFDIDGSIPSISGPTRPPTLWPPLLSGQFTGSNGFHTPPDTLSQVGLCVYITAVTGKEDEIHEQTINKQSK